MLVVDDDPDYRALISLLLGELDNPIVQAGSGEEALALAETQRFAVVLLDISLGGGMDGFELAAKLRAIENTAHSPIVFITGSSQSKDQMQRGYDIGAVDYILKPCPEDILRGKIRSLADLYRRTEELRVAELRIRQSQKLESVGRLAAGIAHEINTPLQYMMGNLEYIRSLLEAGVVAVTHTRTLLPLVEKGRLPSAERKQIENFLAGHDAEALRDEALPAADAVKNGVERIAQIVKAMKGFSVTPGAFEPTDINDAVMQTLTIIKGDYDSVAEVETHLGDIPPITCAAGEIRLALLQIVLNAAQAIAAAARGGEKGLITVATEMDGDDIAISVTDTGDGIPEEYQARVLDPFFTTREVGDGVGTGLAAAWAIITREHRGQLTFTTAQGAGTTFVVKLPVRGATQRSNAPLSR